MKNKVFKTVLSFALAAALAVTSVAPAMAAGTSPNDSWEREEKNNETARKVAEEGIVLLDNRDMGNGKKALPITPTSATKIALYGVGVYGTIKGGTGSGSTNPKSTAKWDVLSAFKDADYNVVNEKFLLEMKDKAGIGDSGMSASAIYDEGEYKAEDVDAAAELTDTAIYVITRNSGEFADRNLAKGDYYLYDSEYKNLEKLAATFDKVIVALNVGGVIDTNFYHGLSDAVNVREVKANGALVEREKIEGLDALVLMSQGGLEGGNALVNVLNGTVTPSGKLTDTWAIDYIDYPSAEKFSYFDLSAKDAADRNTAETLEEIYNDDIYVGYRYFDTYGVEVAYPFGYGLSYADFSIHNVAVTSADGKVKVVAKVTNTSTEDITGKEVVQVYFSAPQGADKLDKPYQELAGYAKTEEIGRGQTKDVEIEFDAKDMASYDESKAAYVLEAGDYTIRVGNSSRNTDAEKTFRVAAPGVITEQYENQLGVTRKQLIDGTYPEGTVLNNTYEMKEVQGWWGPQMQLVGTPQYNNAKEKAFSILTGKDSITLPTDISGKEVADDAGSPTSLSVTANATKPAYSNGDVTAYISPKKDSYSAEYAEKAKNSKSNFRWPDEKNPAKEKLEYLENEKDGKFTLVDVALGDATLEDLVADMSDVELADLVEGGTYAGLADTGSQEPMIGSQADSVPGAAGETTKNLYATRYIPNIVLSDGPAGLRVTPEYTSYSKVEAKAEFSATTEYYTMEMKEVQGWFGPQLQAVYTKAEVTADDFEKALKEGNGLYTKQDYYQYCTAIPIGTMIAQTWNKDLIEQIGREVIGTEMLEYSVTSWLAPGMNIHRNPMCGRNFEYFSEDPLVAGTTAACETKGVQTDENGDYSGVGVTLKHYAFNNQEQSRNGSNSVMSERAAREIYLKGFEIAVRTAQPDYIMTSYNMINGYPTFGSYALVTRMLRNEWKFNGFVMTDWGSTGTYFGKFKDQKVNIQGMLNYAGNDCDMPGGNVQSVLDALEEGQDMRLGDLQKSAINMLKVIQKSAIFKKLQKKLITSNGALQDALDEVKKEIENLDKQLKEAEANLAEMTEKNEASEAELKAAQDLITDLNEQKDNAAQQIKNLEDRINESESDLAATNAALAEATKNLEALQNDLKEAAEKIAAANKEAADNIAEANKALAEANDKIAEANDKLEAANKDALAKLEAANKDAAAKLEAANKDAAAKLEAANKDAAAKLEAANKDAAAKLEAANKDAADKLAAANKDAADKLQAANDKVAAANKDADDKVAAANKDAADKIAAANKDADDKIAAANKEAADKLAELEKKLEEAMKNQGSQGGQNTPAVKVVTDKAKYTVKVKKSVKIAALASDGSKLTFKSNKPKVAKVNKKGKVTGKKKGTAKITVTSASGASVTVTVKVKK